MEEFRALFFTDNELENLRVAPLPNDLVVNEAPEELIDGGDAVAFSPPLANPLRPTSSLQVRSHPETLEETRPEISEIQETVDGPPLINWP